DRSAHGPAAFNSMRAAGSFRVRRHVERRPWAGLSADMSSAGRRLRSPGDGARVAPTGERKRRDEILAGGGLPARGSRYPDVRVEAGGDHGPPRLLRGPES